MKQTVVEWLVDYIENQNKYGYEFHPKYAEYVVQQAKEIEKQQIIDAFTVGNRNEKYQFETAEQYCNETFNK